MCTCERRYILHEIRNVPKFMKCYALTTLNLSKLASCSGMRSWQIPYTHQIKARPCSPFFTSSPLEFKMGSQQSQFRALWALWISTADDDNLNPRLHYSGNFRQNSHKYLCSFFSTYTFYLKKRLNVRILSVFIQEAVYVDLRQTSPIFYLYIISRRSSNHCLILFLRNCILFLVSTREIETTELDQLIHSFKQWVRGAV